MIDENEGRVMLNGAAIKHFRKRLYLSQSLFVERCLNLGCIISISTLKRAESGKKVYYRTAREIAMALDVNINELLASKTKDTKRIVKNSFDALQIVGRTSQLQQIKAVIDSLKEQSQGQMFYIRGVTGIGKTHFISAVKTYAESMGYEVVLFQVSEGLASKSDALKVLVLQLLKMIVVEDCFDPHILKKEFVKNSIKVQDERFIYSILGLSTTESFNIDNFDDINGNKIAVEALLTLIKVLDKPIILVFEDIHWAEDDLLLILKLLGSEISSLPVALIMSSQLEHDPIDKVWRNASLNTPFSILDLPPLTEVESVKLCFSLNKVPDYYKQKCLAVSAGNPLYLKVLLDHYPKCLEVLPESLLQLVTKKFMRYDPEVQEFLSVSAAIAHEFNPVHIESILKIDAVNLDRLIEECLICTTNGRDFNFVDDIIRQGIYANISKQKRFKVHRQITYFYKVLDPEISTYHSMLANNILMGKPCLNVAEGLLNKNTCNEALTKVDLALSINQKSESFSLYYLKGVLLKLLGLASKATSYFETALSLASNEDDRLKVCLELTEVYAVKQHYESSISYLEIAEKLIEFKASDENRRRVRKFRFQVERSKMSMNESNHFSSYSQPDDLINRLNDITAITEISRPKARGEIVKIAILCSQTGFLRDLESGIVKTIIMALDEINGSGGLLGYKIEFELFDGKSNENVFEKQAKIIFEERGISTIFGSSITSSRKQVKTIVEEKNGLLIYPFHYEGLESSAHVAYIGPPSNLQIIPSVDWLIEQDMHSYYFVGSDYDYSVATNEIFRDTIGIVGLEVLGEAYVSFDDNDFKEVIDDIKSKKPDVVILTLVGLQSNRSFLRQFNDAKLSTETITILSLTLSENDLREIPVNHCYGIYSLLSYFRDFDDDFVQSYNYGYGKNEPFEGNVDSVYLGVKMWAEGVQKCQSFEPGKVIKAMKGVSHYGPGGVAYMDEHNNHIWRSISIARVEKSGECHVVWNSKEPLSPNPYPCTRSREEWHTFVDSLKSRWDNSCELRS